MSQPGTKTRSRLAPSEAIWCQLNILCSLAQNGNAGGDLLHEQGRIRDHFRAGYISGFFLADDEPKKVLLLPVDCLKPPAWKLATIRREKEPVSISVRALAIDIVGVQTYLVTFPVLIAR